MSEKYSYQLVISSGHIDKEMAEKFKDIHSAWINLEGESKNDIFNSLVKNFVITAAKAVFETNDKENDYNWGVVKEKYSKIINNLV